MIKAQEICIKSVNVIFLNYIQAKLFAGVRFISDWAPLAIDTLHNSVVLGLY